MASTQLSDADANNGGSVVTSHAVQDSPFLLLPGELRNEVYSYIFDSSTYYIKSRRRTPGSTKPGLRIIESADYGLPEERCRLPLLLTCRQIYCEISDISLQLSTFIFSCLTILPCCIYIPTHVLTRIQHVRILESVTVECTPQPFLDEVLPKGLELRDILPNIRSIEYTVQASAITLDEFMEINGPHFSSYGVVQQWFQNAGDVELRRRVV